MPGKKTSRGVEIYLAVTLLYFVSAFTISHRVIFMDGGKIVEDCSSKEFFIDPEARSPRAKEFLSKILQH